MSIFGIMSRTYKMFNPPTVPRDSNPLRFGVLSAADITVAALIAPAKSHPGVVITAIGGRDETKVTKFAKKHGIKKVYSGSGCSDAVVNDPDIDAVYIPLPHVYHYEWSLKALNAGKHVLVEKPMVNTPEEAAKLHDVAQEKGLVILEAMHIRFHPAIQRVKQIVDSGELGAVTHVEATGLLPKGVMTRTYTEKDFKDGRGVLMDLGCYPIEAIRYFTSPTSMIVSSATHTSFPDVKQLDYSAEATLEITAPFTPSSASHKPNLTASFRACYSNPNIYGIIPNLDMGIKIQCTNGSVKLSSYMIPTIYHKIVVKKTEEHKGATKVQSQRVEKVHVFASGKENANGNRKSQGEPWWSTYRYQLEAFVDMVREREPRTWYEKGESVQNLEWIVQVYRKLGLEPRPPSNFFILESQAKEL